MTKDLRNIERINFLKAQKISNFEIVQTIETIEQGQWESQISEPEQETLFDDEESF